MTKNPISIDIETLAASFILNEYKENNIAMCS